MGGMTSKDNDRLVESKVEKYRQDFGANNTKNLLAAETDLVGKPVNMLEVEKATLYGSTASIGEEAKKRIAARQSDIVTRKYTNPGRRQTRLVDILMSFSKPAQGRNPADIQGIDNG